MNIFSICFAFALSAALAFLSLPLAAAEKPPRLPEKALTWNSEAKTLSANLKAAPVESVLGKLAGLTGWEIYREPGTARGITAKFEDLRSGEAIRFLLGDLNFALVPRPGLPSQLLIYSTSVERATERVAAIPEIDPKLPIPNELIVTLDPDAEESIEDLAKRLGAKVVGTADGLSAHRLEFEDATAADAARVRLEKEAGVAKVDSNYAVPRPDRSPDLARSSVPSFGLNPSAGPSSSQVIVALLDTGLQPLEGTMNDFLLPGIHVAGMHEPAGDLPSHGTSMATAILHGLDQATREVSDTSPMRILPIDIYGPNDGTTTFEMAAGLHAAINSGASIINLSLGGEGDSRFLQALIHDAAQRGVLIFGSAGNIPSDIPIYPAAYPEVIAVTAGDARGQIASYANYGAFVDAIGPGSMFVNHNGQRYVVSGTSPAAATLSGVAAGLLSAGATPEQTREEILRWFGKGNFQIR